MIVHHVQPSLRWNEECGVFEFVYGELGTHVPNLHTLDLLTDQSISFDGMMGGITPDRVGKHRLNYYNEIERRNAKRLQEIAD